MKKTGPKRNERPDEKSGRDGGHRPQGEERRVEVLEIERYLYSVLGAQAADLFIPW